MSDVNESSSHQLLQNPPLIFSRLYLEDIGCSLHETAKDDRRIKSSSQEIIFLSLAVRQQRGDCTLEATENLLNHLTNF